MGKHVRRTYLETIRIWPVHWGHQQKHYEVLAVSIAQIRRAAFR